MSTESLPASRGASTEVSVDIPDIDRKLVLLYLVARLGGLSRTAIERLAVAIDSVTEPRPIAEVSRAAQLINGQKRLSEDTFLNYVALSYDAKELHKPPLEERRSPNDLPPAPVDTLAGNGPSRPLLRELYSLEGLGLVGVKTGQDGEEIFMATTRGSAYATTLREILENVVDWKGHRDFLAVVSRFRTDIQPRQAPKQS